MTTESMAQAIYDAAGTDFRYNADADPAEAFDDFFTITQGVAVEPSALTLEGFGKRLRRGISAFFHVTARMTIGAAGTGGQPITLDLAPMLSNDVGSVGGIPCGAGCTFPASAVVGGVAVPGAAWAASGNASAQFHLVDHTGANVTTALANNDRLGFCISGVSIDD